MSIREDFEKREKGFISPFGCVSTKEDPCPIRTVFQVDRGRIVYSNAFRRLKYKTQVFLSPLGDEYRTRLTHTLEVAEIARTIARAMYLNEDLAEAIALGHDLGHTPFGHGGETVLKEIFSPDFSHKEQSLRVVDVLENNGRGLNLTYEVRDGILKHSKGYGKIMPDDPDEEACTTEGNIVRIADIMAYLNHDLDDAVRSGVVTSHQIPDSCIKVLGRTHSERANTMIKDLVFSTCVRDSKLCLEMSDRVYSSMTVYRSPRVHKEFVKAKKILSELYAFFLQNEKMLQKNLEDMQMTDGFRRQLPIERIVCDFIASMTDRDALNLYKKIFFPSPQF
ncbi:MAG: deoxyguanosinetriphosphate triphosphohydrolase [Deltaproteobacteria bacterium]|nr:deoxyguanosinetriphosphate triphosphohydrolase [Deltaproteobacteria bacterium]